MKNKFEEESDPDKNRIRVSMKPRSCSVFGSKRIAIYLYGLPNFTDELVKEPDEGKRVLGGC
jgi:hypothetical protein